MLLFLLLPPLVAGCAAAIGTADPPRRSGPDDARGTAPPPCARSAVSGTADRVWRTSLLALVVGYAILVLLAARFPLLPPVESSDVAPLPNPLTNYFLTIAVAATAVLPDRVRFAHVTALAIPLAGTYPVDAGYSSRIPVEEVLIYLTSDLGNMGVLTWLLHQTGILDEADARRRDLVIRLRTDESRSRVRRAGDDFIHDHVLPVLKSVPTAPTGSPRLRRSAHEALTSLSGVPGPQRAPACPASELLGTLTTRLRGIGETTSSHRARSNGTCPYPAMSRELSWTPRRRRCGTRWRTPRPRRVAGPSRAPRRGCSRPSCATTAGRDSSPAPPS